MKAVDFVVATTKNYVEQMPKAQRKKCGQFFTSPETAVFMAQLLKIPSKKRAVSILDPGAGSGVLTAAVVDKLNEIPAVEEIHLICYENNQDIVGLLHTNLDWIKKHVSKKIVYEIRQENYILSQKENYNGTFMQN